MRYVYWLIKDEIGARAGPNEVPWQAQELFDGGIRAVLSVNNGDGVVPRDLKRLGIHYLKVPLPITTPPGPRELKQCLRKLPKAYAFALREINNGRPVLVHCRHGNDRTGLFLVYYLARRYGMSADQAIEEVRSRRAGCLTAQGWQRLSRELVKSCLPAIAE